MHLDLESRSRRSNLTWIGLTSYGSVKCLSVSESVNLVQLSKDVLEQLKRILGTFASDGLEVKSISGRACNHLLIVFH